MDSLPPDILKHVLATAFSHLVANKYYVLASTVMLVYDHMLTFDREVKYMWQGRKSFLFYLFLIFRYWTPIVSLLNLVAEHDPTWIGNRCKNWIWLPVAIGPIVSAATGVILILRVHAIYKRAMWVLYITVPIYLGQLAVMGWSIPAGIPAPLPPGFIGCVPSPKPGTGIRLSVIYIAALSFDATIFALTLARAIYSRFTDRMVPLATLIIRDGTWYFAVLFAVNLTNVFLLSLAPDDLSAINAPFATMITAVLVARLMFNLRQAADRGIMEYSTTANGFHTMAVSTMRATSGPVGTISTFLDMADADEFAVPLGDHIFESPEDTIRTSAKKGPSGYGETEDIEMNTPRAGVGRR